MGIGFNGDEDGEGDGEGLERSLRPVARGDNEVDITADAKESTAFRLFFFNGLLPFIVKTSSLLPSIFPSSEN